MTTQVFQSDECATVTKSPYNGGGAICAKFPLHNRTRSTWLGKADAVVFSGCTPPPVRYFGWDMTVNSRFNRTTKQQYWPGECFGDTLNHLEVNTSGVGAFDEPVVLVQSADRGAAEKVFAAYQEAGFDPAAMNLHQINSEEVVLEDRSLGGDYHLTMPDLLTTLGRITMPLAGHENAYKSYRDKEWPIRMYFAADDAQPQEPLAPTLKSREGGADEFALFNNSLALLEQAVLAKFTSSTPTGVYRATHANYFTNLGYYDDWDLFLDNGTLSGGSSFILPTRDAVYGFPDGGLSGVINTQSAAVVMGVQHSHPKALNASYHSVGLDVWDASSGQAVWTKWFNLEDLQGSAERYLPDNPDADKLFAVDFVPQGLCSDAAWASDWCVEFDENATSAHLENYLILGSRIYLNPATTTGPSANRTVPSRVVNFHMQSPGL